jgi:hypothetical protein
MAVRHHRRASGPGLLLSIVVAGLGCGGGSQGALGQAHVSADCPSQDLTCIARGLDGPLAAGAATEIDVMIDFQGAATPATRLLFSHPDILTVDGSRVQGTAAGNATLLIMLAEEDSVIDFMHVWVAEPDRLSIGVTSPDGRELGEASDRAELLSGEALLLAPMLYARGQQLLGEARSTWTADSDVVTLLREPAGGRTRLVARKAGTALVTVESGGRTAQLALEVKP